MCKSALRFEVWTGRDVEMRECLWVGMTNEHIITGLPNAFLVLWFPPGPQWKQCCSASNTHMLPDASESQKQELSALQVSVPPPYTAWLQNMQTDRASLDSPVCVLASDASPQLQTNSVSPAHYSSCRHVQDLVYLNSNWHMYICIHTSHTALSPFFLPKYLFPLSC